MQVDDYLALEKGCAIHGESLAARAKNGAPPVKANYLAG